MSETQTPSEKSSTEWLTLGKAAPHAPGRPSTNCMWRWCRKGVLARDGRRVKLQHVRAGGRVYTTRAWVNEFCTTLANADAAYFDSQRARTALPMSDPPPSTRSRDWSDPAEVARADAVLDGEGI